MALPALAGQADLLLSQEQANLTSNHRGYVMSFEADVRPEHIAEGVRHVVHGLAALRLRFTGSARDGYQQHVVPVPEHEIAIEFHDVSEATERLRSRHVAGILHRDATEWDWERRGVYRFVLVKVGDGTHRLVVSLQQVAIDRLSIRLVLNLLTTAVTAVAAGAEPPPPPDDYESVVVDALRAAAADKAAIPYWEREFDLPDGTFDDHPAMPPARAHSAGTVVGGAAYAALTSDAAGPWGAPAVFLRRLITEWRRFETRTTLVDVHYSSRSAATARQVGMFSTVRPLVVARTDDPSREVVGKLMRAAAYQHVDSCALRRLETARGVPQRPFPVFNFVRRFPVDSATSVAVPEIPVAPFAAPYAVARPVFVRVEDTGAAFEVGLGVNSAMFSAEDAQRFLLGLARV